jgi:hypothetical protein
MKLAIMQPYFFPYIGYWQLLNAVDTFVIYDNIKYTKKGWINRNNYLLNGKLKTFSIPLKKDSDYLNIDDRYLFEGFDKNKLLNQIKGAYGKAPYFNSVFSLIKSIINYKERNLFSYIKNSIEAVYDYLNLNTNIINSSSIQINHDRKGQDKVISICEILNATTYINPIGGVDLYDKKTFRNYGINLEFIKPKIIKYKQFDFEFVDSLSIIDVLMFNNKFEINRMLNLGTIL